MTLNIAEIQHLLVTLRRSSGYNDGDRIPTMLVEKLEAELEAR